MKNHCASRTVLLNVRSNMPKQCFHSCVQCLALVLIINVCSCLSAEDLKVSSLKRITVTVDGDEGNAPELQRLYEDEMVEVRWIVKNMPNCLVDLSIDIGLHHSTTKPWFSTCFCHLVAVCIGRDILIYLDNLYFCICKCVHFRSLVFLVCFPGGGRRECMLSCVLSTFAKSLKSDFVGFIRCSMLVFKV